MRVPQGLLFGLTQSRLSGQGLTAQGASRRAGWAILGAWRERAQGDREWGGDCQRLQWGSLIGCL